jgi:hypothetical protein
MKKVKSFGRNCLTLNYDFTGLRVRDALFIPVKWNLTIDFNIIAKNNYLKKEYSPEELKRGFNINNQRLYYFLDVNLPNAMLVDATVEEDVDLANMSSNMMVYFPGEVNDFTFAKLLHSKLSILSEDIFEVGQISIKADDTFLQYTYNHEGDDYDLPMLTEDYCKFGKMRDKSCWWARNDGFCFEFLRPDDTKLTDEELYGNIIDPLSEFEDLILDENDNNIKEPAKIVQIEKWKPKKI